MSGLSFKDVLEVVLRESNVPPKHLAADLNTSYSMLMNCANASIENANLRAQMVIPLTKLTGDTRLLDFMEAAVGRVAIPIPKIPRDMKQIESMVADNCKEFGDCMQALGEALGDGQISDREFKKIETEVHEQVNSAMALLEACRQMVTE